MRFGPMALYLFHLHECGTILHDAEGREAADLEAARGLAVETAREIMCDEIRHGRLCLSCKIEIMSEEGKPLLDVPFREAIEISGA
jgi:hypothetical protein